MGAASFKTCLTSALKILDRDAAFMNAEGASFAAETLAEMPGTCIPRANSTARTVCTKFTWTKEYNQCGRRKEVARRVIIHPPSPGVWLASIMGSFIASMAATVAKLGSRWESAVMTAVQMSALW